MIRTLKWLYELGYNRAHKETISYIGNIAQFHRQQAEIAAYRRKEDTKMGGMSPPRMSAEQHTVAAQALEGVLAHLDPESWVNVDRIMDEIL